MAEWQTLLTKDEKESGRIKQGEAEASGKREEKTNRGGKVRVCRKGSGRRENEEEGLAELKVKKEYANHL